MHETVARRDEVGAYQGPSRESIMLASSHAMRWPRTLAMLDIDHFKAASQPVLSYNALCGYRSGSCR